MNILLTGGAGFIGSHLLEYLLFLGHRVTVIDDLSTGRKENLATACALGGANYLSLRFHTVAPPLSVPGNFDAIIHLAALGSVPRSIKDPWATFTANVTGTQSVFDFARERGIPTVLYASSSSVYGNQGGLKFEGLDTSKPISPYAASKCFAEVQAHAYARAYGINMVGLRFFNVFGPRQRADSEYAAVVPKFCTALLRGEPMPIFGDGQQKRTFTPVDFVVKAIVQLLRVEFPQPTVLNITDESFALTVETLAYAIAQALDKPADIVTLPERPGDIRESIGSGSMLSSLIDLPQVAFREALKKTCAWYASGC